MARSSVIMEMTGEEAKLLQAYQSAMRQNQQFKAELADLARTGRQSRTWFSGFQQGVRDAFSPAGLVRFAGTLAGTAGGISVAGALQRVVSLAGEARQEIKGFADELTETYTAAKALWTVSESAGAYAQLTKAQREAMAREGLTRQQAADLLFNLKSLGKEEALPEIARAARFMEPETAAKYYTTAASDLAYGAEAGTPQQVLSGLLAGAEASKFNPNQTAEWFLRVAPSMAQFETGMAELLAVGASISEAAPNEQVLATYLTAGQNDLAQWQAEALRALKEPEPAPTAPEKPEYKPPEKPDRMYSSPQAMQNAELRHQEMLAAYEERHAEEMAEYQAELADYRRELAEWEQTGADRRRIAEAAENAHGLVETFEAMRKSDPEAYAAARLSNVRFEKFAAAFEKGIEEAKALEPVIAGKIESARPYQVQTEERPRQLTEQQRLAQSEEFLRLASEGRQEEEIRLKTLIRQNKTLAEITGQSDVLTVAWEKLLETGATAAGTEAASREAADALVDTLYARRPELFEKHLADLVPLERATPRYAGMGYGTAPTVDPTIPAGTDREQLMTAIAAAMLELVETERIDPRHEADLDEARQDRQRREDQQAATFTAPPANASIDLPTPETTVVVRPTPATNDPAVVKGLDGVREAIERMHNDLKTPNTYLGNQIAQPLTDPERN